MWLVVVAVAAVAVLGVGAFVLVGRGDDSRSSSDDASGQPPSPATESTAGPASQPEQVVEPVDATRAYFQAVVAGDCAYMIDHSTPASWSSEGQSRDQALAECQADTAGATGLEGLTVADVTLVRQTVDTALVRVDVTLGGRTETRELPVQLVDGVWLVDIADADRGGPGGG
jgi:hypothetical protein